MEATWEYLSGDWYSNGRALLGLILPGNIVVDLGDSDNVEFSFEPSKIERYRKNTSTRVLGRSDANQIAVTCNFSLTQLPPIMQAASFLGNHGEYLTQAAAANPPPVTVANYELGQVVILPNNVFGATIVSVTLGGDPLVESDYRIDSMIGGLQVPRPFDGSLSDGELVITYTAPVVSAATKRQVFGIAQNGGLRAGLMVRQVNAIGPRKLAIANKGLILPTSTKLIGGDEYDTHEFTMALEVDETKPAGFQLGRVLDISNTVLAA
jgi:hypothetical protein